MHLHPWPARSLSSGVTHVRHCWCSFLLCPGFPGEQASPEINIYCPKLQARCPWHCTYWSYKALVTWMVLIYCRFCLTQAAMLTFLPLGFPPWTSQPFHGQPAQQWCQWVKALWSFQQIPTCSTDIKHLCVSMMLAETAKRCVFQWRYSCQYCHLPAAGRKAYHCRPDLSLHCSGYSIKINSHFLPCHKMHVLYW